MTGCPEDKQPSVLVHVVLISFRDAASVAQREEILDAYRSLGERCGGAQAGILFWQVGPNFDLRKNWHLVELAIFRDDDALQRFRRHPAHAALTSRLSALADWAVGDLLSSGLAAAFP